MVSVVRWRSRQGLSDTLAGSRKTLAPFDITFLDNVPWRELCENDLSTEDVSFFFFNPCLRCYGSKDKAGNGTLT